MQGKEGKPPISLEQHKPGSLEGDEQPRYAQRRTGGGGGTNWTAGIAGAVIAVAISAAMLFMFNPLKTPVNTLAGQVASIGGQVAGFQTSLSQTQTTLDNALATQATLATKDSVAGLATQQSVADLGATIANLSNQDSSLTTQLADIDARLKALETPPATTPPTVGSIRWGFDDPILLYGNGNTVVVTDDTEVYLTGMTRIEDEDLYYGTLVVQYNGDASQNMPANWYVELELRPAKSTDYALLSEDTYVDTDERPTLSGCSVGKLSSPIWDASFYTRTREGIDVTKYVIFDSSTLSALTINPDGYIDIPLVLELHYAE